MYVSTYVRMHVCMLVRGAPEGSLRVLFIFEGSALKMRWSQVHLILHCQWFRV